MSRLVGWGQFWNFVNEYSNSQNMRESNQPNAKYQPKRSQKIKNKRKAKRK